MLNSNTFRLFISSTFSDFENERKILQKKVFPYIQDYCTHKKLKFQPIDLRWGVSNEAQLDQKTLELCLNEVRNCKAHPYPNFLVMLGSRYGWVPLPSQIEKNEFSQLVNASNSDNEKNLLEEWYELDENEIPSSFFLKQRENDYEKEKNWLSVEDKLRQVLQRAARQLPKAAQSRYFLSATEAEIIEGIIPYLQCTDHQKILLKKDKAIKEADAKYVFAFFREVERSSKQSNKFIDQNLNKIKTLKKNLEEIISGQNILNIKTKQLDKNNIDEFYLEQKDHETHDESFESRVKCFLKEQIDNSIQHANKFTPLDSELEEQNYFAKLKRQNFLGQEKALKEITDYINGSNTQVLIISGASGIGKSSIMAQAIMMAEKDKNTLFRFVGATSDSSTLKGILLSLFDQLNINILKSEKSKSLEEFYDEVNSEILKIKKDIVIFIDAVDQLHNEDNFSWLPEKLPQNIKIIISALDDDNYKDDSRYYHYLKAQTNNNYKVNALKENNAKELVKTVLEASGRKLQADQEKYFIKQFRQSPNPLYAYIASQELKHLKSADKIFLESTKQGIIERFLSNLIDVHHHHKEFVERVLGYLFISVDGLSESELLELIETDEQLINSLVPETFHENANKKLPLVYWTRLFNVLKPYISFKKQDGEVLMYFFHREMLDVIQKKSFINQVYEKAISSLFIIIKQKQNLPFNSNRWGKLYIKTIEGYYLHNSKIMIDLFTGLILNLNHHWLQGLIHFLGSTMYKNNDIAFIFFKLTFELVKSSNNDKATYFKFKHDDFFISLAEKYIENSSFKKAIELYELFYSPKERNEKLNFSLLPEDTENLNQLAYCYKKIGQYKKATQIYKEIINNTIIDDSYGIEGKGPIELYSDNLGTHSQYISFCNNLFKSYTERYKYKNAIDAFHEFEKNYFWGERDIFIPQYINIYIQIGEWYLKTHNIKQALHYLIKAVEEILICYEEETLYRTITKKQLQDYFKILSFSEVLISQDKNLQSILKSKYKDILYSLNLVLANHE